VHPDPKLDGGIQIRPLAGWGRVLTAEILDQLRTDGEVDAQKIPRVRVEELKGVVIRPVRAFDEEKVAASHTFAPVSEGESIRLNAININTRLYKFMFV